MYCSSLIPYEYYHLSKNMTVEGDEALLIQMIRLQKSVLLMPHKS